MDGRSPNTETAIEFRPASRLTNGFRARRMSAMNGVAACELSMTSGSVMGPVAFSALRTSRTTRSSRMTKSAAVSPVTGAPSLSRTLTNIPRSVGRAVRACPD